MEAARSMPRAWKGRLLGNDVHGGALALAAADAELTGKLGPLAPSRAPAPATVPGIELTGGNRNDNRDHKRGVTRKHVFPTQVQLEPPAQAAGESSAASRNRSHHLKPQPQPHSQSLTAARPNNNLQLFARPRSAARPTNCTLKPFNPKCLGVELQDLPLYSTIHTHHNL
eukprot:363985-Chlamydomonas_euryale.AAC.10